eukprot:gene34258-38720_t
MLVEGEKFTITDKDVLIPFGTVAYLINAEAQKGQDRSQLGLVLGPSEDSSHAYECFVFSTKKRVVRSTRDIDIPDIIPDEVDWTVKPGRHNKPTAMNHGKRRKKGANKPGPKTRVINVEEILRNTPYAINKGKTVEPAAPNPSPREGEMETSDTPDEEGASDAEADTQRATEVVPVPEPDSDEEASGTHESAAAVRNRERAARIEAAQAYELAKKLVIISEQKLKRAAKAAAQTQNTSEAAPEEEATAARIAENVRKMGQRADAAKAEKEQQKKAAKKADDERRDKVVQAKGLRNRDKKKIVQSWSRADKRIACLMGIVHRIS